MIKYHPYLKGSNVYSESIKIGRQCEISACVKPADYRVKGDRMDDEIGHVCKEHLTIPEFRLQGKCDGCNRSSMEKWLNLNFYKGTTILQLCKKCYTVKRSAH